MIKKVEQNQRTLDPNAPRNLIDSFLIRMQEVHATVRVESIKAGQRVNQGKEEGRTEGHSNWFPIIIKLLISIIIELCVSSTEL